MPVDACQHQNNQNVAVGRKKTNEQRRRDIKQHRTLPSERRLTHLLRLDGKIRDPRGAVRVPILVVQILDHLLNRARAHVGEADDALLGLAEVALDHGAERLDLEGDAALEEDLGVLGGDYLDVGRGLAVVLHGACGWAGSLDAVRRELTADCGLRIADCADWRRENTSGI